MRNDSASQGMLESAELPSCHKEQKRLHDAHFNYQQVIGEAIYAMVTCRQIFVMLSSNSHNTLLTLLRSCSYVANGGTRKFGASCCGCYCLGSTGLSSNNIGVWKRIFFRRERRCIIDGTRKIQDMPLLLLLPQIGNDVVNIGLNYELMQTCIEDLLRRLYKCHKRRGNVFIAIANWFGSNTILS